MEMKISGVYKITNTVTGDFYIGSSKDVKHRWAHHKWPSTWKNHPNNPLYQDIQKYGVEKFDFQILAEVDIEQLKKAEQQLIETLKPTYNDRNANGWNIERHKESNRKANKKYQKSDKYKKRKNKYDNQLCQYNGKKMTLAALKMRFTRAGIEHPTLEAKKYIIMK